MKHIEDSDKIARQLCRIWRRWRDFEAEQIPGEPATVEYRLARNSLWGFLLGMEALAKEAGLPVAEEVSMLVNTTLTDTGPGDFYWGGDPKIEARSLLDSDLVILDTETTGLGDDAEIVEIGIIDARGRVVFESLIKPKNPIPHEATKIHGITNADVALAPKWPKVHHEVCRLIAARNVAIYTAEFDSRLLQQTTKIYGLEMPGYYSWCAMLAYARYYGEWDDKREAFKWQRLTNAAIQTGIEIPDQGQAHRAIYDCLLTLGVMRAMAD